MEKKRLQKKMKKKAKDRERRIYIALFGNRKKDNFSFNIDCTLCTKVIERQNYFVTSGNKSSFYPI